MTISHRFGRSGGFEFNRAAEARSSQFHREVLIVDGDDWRRSDGREDATDTDVGIGRTSHHRKRPASWTATTDPGRAATIPDGAHPLIG